MNLLKDPSTWFNDLKQSLKAFWLTVNIKACRSFIVLSWVDFNRRLNLNHKSFWSFFLSKAQNLKLLAFDFNFLNLFIRNKINKHWPTLFTLSNYQRLTRTSIKPLTKLLDESFFIALSFFLCFSTWNPHLLSLINIYNYLCKLNQTSLNLIQVQELRHVSYGNIKVLFELSND